jgi:hypothetical protein
MATENGADDSANEGPVDAVLEEPSDPPERSHDQGPQDGCPVSRPGRGVKHLSEETDLQSAARCAGIGVGLQPRRARVEFFSHNIPQAIYPWA